MLIALSLPQLALLASPPATAQNSRLGILPPNSLPQGKTYGNWGAHWWMWAESTGFAAVTDETGELAHIGQSGPVYMLAGNFGGTTVRHVTIPYGKSLFFPILNLVGWADDLDDVEDIREWLISIGYNAAGFTVEQVLQAWVSWYFDNFADPLSASCTINGEAVASVTGYRGLSPQFTYGEFELAVADGWWIFMSPLPPGNHTIRFTGSFPAWSFELDVTYHLTVLP
jgi:hypothetical protein